jgi:uncharacterized protein YhaN
VKIVELDLIAFGSFAGTTLDFSDDALHVVFGRNEAGKSTALRAIHGLLFGIPPRTQDAHLHGMTELRVGARLRSDSGAELAFTRRKGNKNTLLGPDGPLDDAALARMLGGINDALFERMFGLTHARLREGAAALLAGQGDVGESLFDASLGGRGIHRVIKELRDEAGELFKAQGKKDKLNVALAKYRAAEDARKRERVSSKTWRDQNKALETASAERDRLAAKRRELVAERERLGRIQKARKPVARRAELLNERAGLERSVALAALDPARRAELHDRLANHNKARVDLPKQRDVLGRSQAKLEAILKRLGKPADLAGVDALRLSSDAQKRIERLGREHGRLVERRDTAKREVRDLQRERDALSENLAALAPPVDAALLARALKDARRAGDVEARIADLDRARADLERRIERGLGELRPRAGTLADLTRAAPPAAGTIDRFDERFADLVTRGRRLREGVETTRKRAAELARELDAIERAGDVPTEGDLERARAHRDAGWLLVRRAWRDGGEVADAARDYDPAQPLDRAFESALEAADAVADRLRREASRVERYAAFAAERLANENELERLAEQGAELDAERAKLDAEWRRAWGELEPLGPKEMRGWLAERARLVDLAAELAKLQADGEAARAAEASVLSALSDALGAEAERLTTLVDRADERVELERRRADLAKSLDAATRALADRRGDLSSSEAELERWREQWGAALAPLGQGADADPEDVGSILIEITELVREAEAAEAARQRIGSMERDAAEFRADVEALLDEHAPDLSGAPLEEAAQALLDRSERARRVEQELAAQEEQLAALREETPLAELTRDVESIDRADAAARLDEIDRDCEELDEQLDGAKQEIWRLQNTLGKWQGESLAAEAAAEAKLHLATVRRVAERYVRLQLAVAVLERELERLREQSHGPIVDRAGELFSRLAVRDGEAQFRGLDVDYGEDDQPVLQCVRRDGTRVAVAGLSEGTAEQLYLALRLASLERYAKQSEPLPLVLDDVLLHSDNERQRAALEVLGEFSRQSQVLFFTHDAHLVDLAREAVPTGRLVCHELGRRTRAA